MPLAWNTNSVWLNDSLQSVQGSEGNFISSVSEKVDRAHFEPNHDMPAEVSHTGLLTPEETHEVEEKKVVSISSAFFPGADSVITDTVFRSSEDVLFYVSSPTILSASQDAFRPILGSSLGDKRFRDGIIDIPDNSSILNIVLHTMYERSCEKHSPTLDDLERAVDRLPSYGLVPKKHLTPSSPLVRLLLFHAPLAPLRVYTLAAHHEIDSLAVGASSYLLSIPLSSITDEMTTRMGARYFRRLAALHLSLIENFKAIILRPPHPHPPTKQCDFEEQKKLSRAWALAASYLAWESDPGIPISKILSTFNALGDHLPCTPCKEGLVHRIKDIAVLWANVKRTI